jgi:hypothetical protein
MGFYLIRTWAWIKILTHGHANGQKAMSIGYAVCGRGIVSLEPANPWSYVYPLCIWDPGICTPKYGPTTAQFIMPYKIEMCMLTSFILFNCLVLLICCICLHLLYIYKFVICSFSWSDILLCSRVWATYGTNTRMGMGTGTDLHPSCTRGWASRVWLANTHRVETHSHL